MDIQAIRTFIEVANLENFTKAAQELKYAQSTVTMQIQRLEEELGFPLFERIGRRNYLTPAAQEFVPYAMEMLHIMQKVGMINRETSTIAGNLRIGALESLMFSMVLPVIPKMHAAFPNVNIQLQIGQAADLLSLLKQNQLDFAYAFYNMSNNSLLSVSCQHSETVAFIASKQHPLASRTKIPLNELLTNTIISTETSGRCYAFLQELALQAGIVLSVPIIVDNNQAVCTLVSKGLGISILPECGLKEVFRSGSIVKLDVGFPLQDFYSEIVYHKNKWISPYMQYFLDLIECKLKEGH